MAELDFTIEFSSPLRSEAEADLFAEADTELRKLRKGHDDIVGAAINIQEAAKGEQSYLYEATVVVYGRPEHVAATEKNENITIALKGALDAVERQIRKRREKLSKRWEEPGKGPVTQEIEEVVGAEMPTPEVESPDSERK